ncbi:cytochrome P450 CYP71D312-like [Apium graveolens]|uniref:cytochrome P450 CYP71D312-like n=1 Tax=Apium graveolens TaxID=4045 RepID=UPI003D7A3399
MKMELPSPFAVASSLLVVTFLLLHLVKKSKRQSKTNLPPGPWKLPILGNLFQVAGKIPHRGLIKLAEKYGPLMHLQLGEISAIVISDPSVAKEVLRTHDLAFADRPVVLLGNIILANCRDIVLALYGDYWRQMRKICTLELLSANKVRSFRSIREGETWKLIQSIQLSPRSSLIDVSHKVSALANAVTCRATIGQACKYQDELIELVEEIAYLGSGFFLADLFPSMIFLPTLSGMKPALKKIRKKLDVIFDGIIKEHNDKLSRRKKGSDIDAEEEDLVDVLLRINDSQRLEFPISSGDIQGLVLDMLTAGTDTSSAVLEWAMSELMRNPKVMKKVQSEVRGVVKGKERIEEVDIQQMSYLKLVVKETLRLHPPVPLLLPRECRKECEINGYTIPVGTKVMVNVWAIGRDPDHWVDAESFIPERFENNSVDYIGANFEFLPFGAGRRMCAGISFGIATVELPLAQLLHSFDWKLPDEMKPEDLDMDETNAATCKRKNNLMLIATDLDMDVTEVS